MSPGLSIIVQRHFAFQTKSQSNLIFGFCNWMCFRFERTVEGARPMFEKPVVMLAVGTILDSKFHMQREWFDRRFKILTKSWRYIFYQCIHYFDLFIYLCTGFVITLFMFSFKTFCLKFAESTLRFRNQGSKFQVNNVFTFLYKQSTTQQLKLLVLLSLWRS